MKLLDRLLYIMVNPITMIILYFGSLFVVFFWAVPKFGMWVIVPMCILTIVYEINKKLSSRQLDRD